jgi:hypothetical protein
MRQGATYPNSISKIPGVTDRVCTSPLGPEGLHIVLLHVHVFAHASIWMIQGCSPGITR